MLEYYPWSNQVIEEALASYASGKFTILDMQLGGGCNFSCLYCDTPDRSIKSNVNVKWIEEQLTKGQIKWIFICGLGEPTHNSNIVQLKAILEICQNNNVKCSMFTNLSLIDEEIKEFIRNGVLYILFKLDTFDSKMAQDLFGVKNLESYFNEVFGVRELVKIDSNHTNIAASIVPTQKNKSELVGLINYCLDNGIYPLVGDLEDSGKSLEIYNTLKVSATDLSRLKGIIENERHIQYRIPICPSVICGVHIDYKGKVVVDENTGLSCHWFWLKEPKVKILIESVYNDSFENVEKSIMIYRNNQLSYVRDSLTTINYMVFGGCGGDLKSLFSKYIDVMDAM